MEIAGGFNSFASVLNEAEVRETLLAIASIAVVVWTGGVIAIQIKELSGNIVGTNDLLQFAYIAPVTALLASPATLQLIGGAFAMLFAWIGVGYMRSAMAAMPGAKNFWDLPIEAQEIFKYGAFNTLITLFCLIFVYSPGRVTVAWLSLLCLFLGLQRLIGILYGDPDKTQRDTAGNGSGNQTPE